MEEKKGFTANAIEDDKLEDVAGGFMNFELFTGNRGANTSGTRSSFGSGSSSARSHNHNVYRKHTH